MGYLSELTDVDLENVVVDDVKAFTDEVHGKCEYGFEEDNTKFIFKGNELVDIEYEEYFTKWYDDEDFGKVLSKHMISGKAMLSFTGEDSEKWKLIVFPKTYPIFEDYIKFSGERFKEFVFELKKKDTDKKVVEKIIKEYRDYWKSLKEKAEENLKGVEDV